MASNVSSLERPPPTTAAIAIAASILAGVAGYFIGQGSSLGLFSRSSPPESKGKSNNRNHGYESSDEEEEEEEEIESDEESQAQGELATFEGNKDEVKLVLVVRTDLGMGKGE